MSRYGRISLSLMNFQMIRVISSPSISTTGFFTLIFGILLPVEPRISMRESVERGVQGRARPHPCRCLGLVGQIIAAGIHRLTLRGDQLGIDLGLVGLQGLRHRLEAGGQRR